MSTRKNQNSLLFLATLSVYLGLVLTGAAPSVLAHAALSKQFDVSDEIIHRDDLDNKPDDDRTPVAVSLQGYLEDVEYFLNSLRGLRLKGNFDTRYDGFDVAQATMLPCVNGNMAGSYSALAFSNQNEKARPALTHFAKLLSWGYSLGDCLPNDRFSGIDAHCSQFELRLNKTDLHVEVSVKKKTSDDAAQLIAALNSALRIASANNNDRTWQKIVENTKFRLDNDQVFVITRLPRGSLDKLLAPDAK